VLPVRLVGGPGGQERMKKSTKDLAGKTAREQIFSGPVVRKKNGRSTARLHRTAIRKLWARIPHRTPALEIKDVFWDVPTTGPGALTLAVPTARFAHRAWIPLDGSPSCWPSSLAALWCQKELEHRNSVPPMKARPTNNFGPAYEDVPCARNRPPQGHIRQSPRLPRR